MVDEKMKAQPAAVLQRVRRILVSSMSIARWFGMACACARAMARHARHLAHVDADRRKDPARPRPHDQPLVAGRPVRDTEGPHDLGLSLMPLALAV